MKKKVIVKIIAGVVAIAIVAGAGAFFWSKGNEKNGKMPEMTEDMLIEKAEKNDLRETITASGTVYLADEYEVYAEGESNKVKSIAVEEGDSVTQGQLLVEYDVDDKKEDLEKSIKQTKINLENEELGLKSYTIPKSESEMTQLENAITQAKNSITQAEKTVYDAENTYKNYSNKISKQNTTIETAKKDLDKNTKTVEENKKLLELGGITKEEYDSSVDTMEKSQITYNDAVTELNELNNEVKTAEYALTVAKNSLVEANNSYKTAQDNYNLAKDVFSDEKTKLEYQQKQNSIELQKISLADYEKQLEDIVYNTKSDVNGIVTEICVDEGNYTEENTILMKIANYDELIVKANISEYDAPLLEVGQAVEMTSDGIEDKVYTGKITKIGLSAQSAETTMGSETVVPIEISVENPDGILKPSYTLDLEIINVNREQVLTVSANAIGTDEKTKEKYVYKIDNANKIYKTIIETGVEGEVYTEILSGISEGEKVINNAELKIEDGMELSEIKNMQMPNKNSQTDSNNKNKENGQMNGGMPGGMGGGMPMGGGGMPMGGGPR